MDTIFEGDVNVYLWGNGAITDGEKENSDLYNRFLIGSRSDLVLLDNRELGWTNAKEFNVPSHVKVEAEFSDDDLLSMKITLTKPEKLNEVTKTLLLGVSEDSTIPVYDLEWEVYKPHEPEGVVVVVLINGVEDDE